MGGLLAQGLGTSMLQVPNIIRKPMIAVPPIVASIILGPIVTTIVPMTNIPGGAGMGTSGLVGQFGAVAAMGSSPDVLIKILIFHFVLPAAISLVISEYMRKKNLIKFGDLKLDI